MFGLLFGLGLYARYQQDPDGFKTGYDALLSSTGLADAATLAARFGIDIRTPDFWRASLAIIGQDIDQFVRLVDTAPGPDLCFVLCAEYCVLCAEAVEDESTPPPSRRGMGAGGLGPSPPAWGIQPGRLCDPVDRYISTSIQSGTLAIAYRRPQPGKGAGLLACLDAPELD
jgi:hypothetical protein